MRPASTVPPLLALALTLLMLLLAVKFSARGTVGSRGSPMLLMAASRRGVMSRRVLSPMLMRTPRTLSRQRGGWAAFSSEGDAAAAPPAEKKPEEPAEPAGPPPAEEFAKTELRVGQIVEVWPHPEADKLWCEKIDIGEEEPRQILSGLREFYSEEEMKDKKVVIVANLKRSKLRGMDSSGMVLCASNEAHDKVELLSPPEGTEIGERVSLENFDCSEVAPANAKKKGNSAWRAVAPFMKTNSDGVATYDGTPLVTKAGPIKAPSLKDCHVG